MLLTEKYHSQMERYSSSNIFLLMKENSFMDIINHHFLKLQDYMEGIPHLSSNLPEFHPKKNVQFARFLHAIQEQIMIGK